MRVLSLIVAMVFLLASSSASAMKAKCLNAKGKYSGCKVEVTDGHLLVNFNSKKSKNLNRDIPGTEITGLSSGEYARRRVAESVGSAVLLGPLMLFMLFSKKKRDTYGVEYVNSDGINDAVLIQVKKKYSHALSTQLKSISSLPIVKTSEENPKKNENADRVIKDENTEKIAKNENAGEIVKDEDTGKFITDGDAEHPVEDKADDK